MDLVMATSLFQNLKLQLVAFFDLSKDALHVHIGLLAFVIVLVLVRRKGRFVIAWAAVVLIAVAGELLDMRDDVASLGRWRWGASVHDIVNTVFWPTVLMTLACITGIFRAKP